MNKKNQTAFNGSFVSRSCQLVKMVYRIYSNKRRCAYLIFRATSAALIRGRRLLKNFTRQVYFFYLFIQRYTIHLLIFLWADTILRIERILERELTARAEKYSLFKLKNITFKKINCRCCFKIVL